MSNNVDYFNNRDRTGARPPSVTTTLTYENANAQLVRIVTGDAIMRLVGMVEEFLNGEHEDTSMIFDKVRFQQYLYTLAATVVSQGDLSRLNLIAPPYVPNYVVQNTRVEKRRNTPAESQNQAQSDERIGRLEATVNNMLIALEPLLAPPPPKEKPQVAKATVKEVHTNGNDESASAQ